MSFWCQFLDLHLNTQHSSTGVQIIVVLDLGHIYLSFRESVLCTFEFGVEFILVFKNSYSDYGKYCGPHYGAYLYTKNSGDNTVSAHF
jgi:hypothetical protein